MIRCRHAILTVVAIAVVLGAASAGAELRRSDVEEIVKDYLSSHPEAVERIVKDYLVRNPAVLRDALAEMIRKRPPTAGQGAQDADRSAAIASHSRALFDSAHQATLGNPQGDVTLVAFVDYNCGYCRRALADTLALLRDDGKLRIVLKEFPILGAASVEAARVSIAARMQDQVDGRYLEFHRRLLGLAGRVDKAAALAVAQEVGFDVARIERDLSSDDVRDTLAESTTLARAIGVRGTPAYVVGAGVIPGAIGVAGLKDRIAAARGKARD